MSDVLTTFRKPFAEQVSAFRLRMLNRVPTTQWTDIWQAEHDRAFMVAGAMNADLLADLAVAIDKAVVDGTTLEQFRKDWAAAVDRHNWHGWTGEGSKKGEAWRTKTVYMTNLRTSYAAGRWAQITEGGFSYIIYKHGGSMDPRPQHLSWDGLVLEASHPFWITHGPPNGWGCSCYVTGARTLESAYRRGGKSDVRLPDGWDAVNPKTGAPDGIDRGWAYTPGRSVAQTLSVLTPKLATLPAAIGADWINTWPDRLFKGWSDAFAAFVDQIDLSKPQGKAFVVGALKPDWIKSVAKEGVAPISADITVIDKEIAHIFRTNKVHPVDFDWFKSLPEQLQKPDLVLLEKDAKGGPSLAFILRSPDGKNRIIVRLNYRTKQVGVGNMITTGRVIFDEDIKSMIGRGAVIVEGNL